MLETPSWKRSPTETAEDADGSAGVTRPVPRRIAPSAHGPASETAPLTLPNFPNVSSGTLNNPASKLQRKSAWARYESPSGSAHHKGVSPPHATDAILATQAAAKQMWDRHAAAESDTTDSATPPPESPGVGGPAPPRSAVLGLGQQEGWPKFPNGSLYSMQDAYLGSLKAALGSHGPGSYQEAPPPRGSGHFPPGAHPPPHQGMLSRGPGDRSIPSNGSLSIVPEHLRRPPSGGGPPPGAHQPGAGPPPLDMAQIALISQQLGELLRSQSLTQQPSAQLPILASEPPLYGGGSGSVPLGLPVSSHPSFSSRFGSGESFREHYPGSGEVEPLRGESSMSRNGRWNSSGSLMSEGGLHPMSSVMQHITPSMMSNLSAHDGQQLMNSIQLLCQANEMAAVANSRIQAFSLAANANLEGLATSNMRKRKMSDFYDDAPKRHNSMLSEGESYGYGPPPHVAQMCAECGTTSTPTWRRSGKKLMCNACGLRRSRSMRSARSNPMPTSIPLGPGTQSPPPNPQLEPKVLGP